MKTPAVHRYQPTSRGTWDERHPVLGAILGVLSLVAMFAVFILAEATL